MHSTLTLDENEWIKSISGYATDCIDYLRIETNYSEVLVVGATNTKERYFEFFLEIGVSEMPITFFGGLDYKSLSIDLLLYN